MIPREDQSRARGCAAALDDQDEVAVSRPDGYTKVGQGLRPKPSPALFRRRYSWSMAKRPTQKTEKELEIPGICAVMEGR